MTSTTEIAAETRDASETPANVTLKVRFTYIEAIKQADTQFADLEYPIDMNIGEATRKLDGTAIIKFALKVATDPSIAIFSVKGEATLKGPTAQVQTLTVPENNAPPPIWRKIYHEAISTVTFLARFLDIPPPPIISNM